MSNGDDEHDCNCPPKGLPAYMGTFADLMALLMCFFVLLLSFAEMDVLKFKRLAGSLATAFGVQRQIDANQIPMGTSIIAQEFSPGRPEPTPINEIRQRTTDEAQRNLQTQCTPDQLTPELEITEDQSDSSDGEAAFVEQLAELIQSTRLNAISIAEILKKQITRGHIEVETHGRQITIRIKEQGSFGSGSARLQDDFDLVLHNVRDVLSGIEGKILVNGHTDNIAISTSRYRSNWELSTARAVSVAEVLLSEGVLNPVRFTVAGYGYTKPLVENDTPSNRALNRRVEIVINQESVGLNQNEQPDITEQDPPQPRVLDIPPPKIFRILPEEIF